MAACQALVDEGHASLPSSPRDSNTHALGRIGPHGIAMACLPSKQYGTNTAAIVGTSMIRMFPRIEERLGDVVGGDQVIQYDLEKGISDGRFVCTSIPIRPPTALMTAVSKLRANDDTKSGQTTSSEPPTSDANLGDGFQPTPTSHAVGS